MKSLVSCFLLLLSIAESSFAWDFLWRDGDENLATRSADPFARMDRVAREDNLPVKWERDGDKFRFFVEWGGEEWTCRDGSMIVPADELPKTISKLDLLLVLHELDKMDAFFAWLDASGLKPFCPSWQEPRS